MSDHVCYSQPAYILHQQHYRESSLIIDALTRDFGRVSLIAKGVRKTKSKTAGLLRPFSELLLSFVGKSGLKTLTDVEIQDFHNDLSGLAFYCGFYVNELVCNFLHKDDPHPDVFQSYKACLSGLTHVEFYEAALRIFELNLLDHIGYGLHLGYDFHYENPIDSHKKYLFDKDNGMVENLNGQFSGKTLLTIQQRDFDDSQVLNEAKILMRTVIDSHLQGKPLKSRAVINSIIKRL